MRFGAYEFEMVASEGRWLAIPFDFEGATQGDDFDELCLMVADWLKVTIENYEAAGRELPRPTFGNAPRHGGATMVFGVSAGLETVERVSATEAARMMGVSLSRVCQMVADGRLMGWKEGRSMLVSMDSVRARLAERPGSGRSRRRRATAKG